MDVLALIAAEPTLLPLWLVVAFAAGMYPVGMFFGCSTCCSPCDSCTEGSLPETLTVTLSGIPETSPGPDLATLTFESCYGSGASGSVAAPGQSAVGGNPADDRGPITAVSLTSGGSGYAKLGRVAPTVTVSSVTGSGEGAEFSVALAQQQDSCGLDRWVVASVSQTGGTGYANGDQLTFAVAEGDTEETAATAVFAPQYGEPTLTLTPPGGTGGVLTIDGYFLRTTGSAAGYYGISGVSVTNGGSGYTDNTQATITLGAGDEQQSSAVIRVRTTLRKPNDEWTLTPVDGAAGSGLAVSLTLIPQFPGSTKWKASSASIVAAGSGYAVGEVYAAEATEGGTESTADLTITAVGATGNVTGLSVSFGGVFASIDTGVIDRVEFQNGWQGAYRKLLSSSGITVTNGGAYYREDPTVPAYTANVTIGVTQSAPSQGSGATIEATIDDDPASETFGQITGLNVADGGDGYLAHELFPSCMSRFNGRSIVVKRSAGGLTSSPCLYGFSCEWDIECGMERELVFVEYRGASQPLRVELGVVHPTAKRLTTDPRYWVIVSNAEMLADALSPDCSNIDVTATGLTFIGGGFHGDATAHVVAGGDYEETDTCRKILLEDYENTEVEISWNGISWSGQATSVGCGMDASLGRYVLSYDSPYADIGVSSATSGTLLLGITRVGCGLKFDGGFTASFSNFVPNWVFRSCKYAYRIIPSLDGEGFPSGAAQVFSIPSPYENVYYPNPYGIPPCADPGPPSVVFSRLP